MLAFIFKDVDLQSGYTEQDVLVLDVDDAKALDVQGCYVPDVMTAFSIGTGNLAVQ